MSIPKNISLISIDALFFLFVGLEAVISKTELNFRMEWNPFWYKIHESFNHNSISIFVGKFEVFVFHINNHNTSSGPIWKISIQHWMKTCKIR